MASVRPRVGSSYWTACITLPDGRRRQFSTKLANKAEALVVAMNAERATHRQRNEKQLRESLSRIASDVCGTEAPAANTWFSEWANTRRHEVAPKTYEAYKAVAKELEIFAGRYRILSLTDITVEHVQKIRAGWADSHSVATANRKLKCFRVALNDAWRVGLITENVAKKVKALKDRQTSVRQPFTADQFAALLKAADVQWRALIILGLWTGQRLNDLAILTEGCVDLEAHTATFLAKKTGATVNLPLVASAMEAIRALPLTGDPSSPLLPDIISRSEVARSAAFHKIMARAGIVAPREHYNGAKKAGLRSGRRNASALTFHSLRHTATTMLKSAGVADSIARAIIGHTSKAVSRIYTHLDIRTMKEALDKAEGRWEAA